MGILLQDADGVGEHLPGRFPPLGHILVHSLGCGVLPLLEMGEPGTLADPSGELHAAAVVSSHAILVCCPH